MNWAIRNFGLTALAASILFSAASLEIRLSHIEQQLAKATQIETSLKVYATAIPISQLGGKR